MQVAVMQPQRVRLRLCMPGIDSGSAAVVSTTGNKPQTWCGRTRCQIAATPEFSTRHKRMVHWLCHAAAVQAAALSPASSSVFRGPGATSKLGAGYFRVTSGLSMTIAALGINSVGCLSMTPGHAKILHCTYPSQRMTTSGDSRRLQLDSAKDPLPC